MAVTPARGPTAPPGGDEAPRVAEGVMMKRLTVLLASACLLPLAFAGPALAQSATATAVGVSTPTVTAILPALAPNDQDTPVVISGSGLLSGAAVKLGTTALGAVIVESDTAITATVPSGLTPGLYDLTVTNPDTGSATLSGAFTVTLPPTVSAVFPASAYNDIDTTVTIAGTDFAAASAGTIVPTVTLGTTPLTNVAFVNDTALTATVPWGMDPGSYDLTVTNPDGGSGTFAGSFTVEAGIGQWNAGALYGGDVRQILMKPGDPDTLYAASYGVLGLFRSDDAGEHWALVSDQVVISNGRYAIDPLHPAWVYGFDLHGLWRSQDEGVTWTRLMPNKWPDGRDMAAQSPQVFVSPYEDATHPQALFVGSCENYGSTGTSGALGLIRSTDGGATWQIVQSLEGVSVQALAFDPNDHAHIVLVTSDMKVYTSSDWGATWTEVATSGLTADSLGLWGSVTYDPSGSEVWIDSFAASGGIFKSAASDLASWQDVSPGPGEGSSCLAFTSDDSVYIPHYHSTDGGASWDSFGPSPWYGQGWVAVDPSDPDVCYIDNDAVGVAEDDRRRCSPGKRGRWLDRPRLHLAGGLAERSPARLRDVQRPPGDLPQR